MKSYLSAVGDSNHGPRLIMSRSSRASIIEICGGTGVEGGTV